MVRRMLRRAGSAGPLDRGTALNTIQAPHIAQRLMRGLGLKEMAPVPELGRELTPVVIVEDLSALSSHDERESWWAGQSNHTAAAGSFSAVGLHNSSTDRVVTVDVISFDATATIDWHILRAGVFAGTAVDGGALIESRGSDTAFGARSGAAEFWTGDLVALPAAVFKYRGGGAGTGGILSGLNWSIPPGLWLWMIPVAAASPNDVSVLWREVRKSE